MRNWIRKVCMRNGAGRLGVPPAWRRCVPLARSALAECQQIAGAPVDAGEHHTVGRAFVQLEFSAGNHFRNFPPPVALNPLATFPLNPPNLPADLRPITPKTASL